MTSLFAKLPPELQVEFEPIRRRLAAPFSRISAQKIFDDHAEPIGKVLALGLTHAQLAEILFELGLTGKDGKQPKTNSVSRSLNRSRQTNEASKRASGGGADPGAIQRNGASHITHSEADGLETVSSGSSAGLNCELADVSAPPKVRAVFEFDRFVRDDGQSPASYLVQCCPFFPGRGFAAEPGETRSQGLELVDQGAGLQVPAPADSGWQASAIQDKINHGAFRQGQATLDKARRTPERGSTDGSHGPCDAIQNAGATDTSVAAGSLAAKAGIAAAPAHASQAQFPIPPPQSPAQHFARACAAGESLIKLRME